MGSLPLATETGTPSVRGKGSGSDISLTESVTWVYRFEAGVVVSVEAFESRDAALRSVGRGPGE
jgi:hypothetical protein